MNEWMCEIYNKADAKAIQISQPVVETKFVCGHNNRMKYKSRKSRV